MAERLVVGVDGSPESLAAAGWAGREAALRGAEVHLLNVWQAPVSNVQFSPSPEELRLWEERRLYEAARRLSDAHPALTVTVAQVAGTPMKVVLETAARSYMVVLGSRGLGAVTGFFFGSVGLHVLAHCDRPVVLVRAVDEPAPAGTEVLLGIDLDRPCDALPAFAFQEAAARDAVLRVVHVWDVHRMYGYTAPALDPGLKRELRGEKAQELTRLLAPWRARFGGVKVIEDVREARAAEGLVAAAQGSGLLVVGRLRRHAPAPVRVGPVTHAVVHHARCPVAVVAHD